MFQNIQQLAQKGTYETICQGTSVNVICYMLQKSVYTGGEEKGLGLRDGVSGLDLYGGLFTILSAVNKDIKFADTS